jgi:AraC-like DNA-binding protein
VIHALDKLGAATDTVRRKAGVTREELEGNTELPIAVTTRLWEEAARVPDDPAFGLNAGRHVRLPALHGLAYAVQASGTLREAVMRFQRYSRVVSDAATLRIEGTSESLRLYFEVKHAEGAPSYEAMDATLSMIVRGLRALTEGRVDLLAVSLRRAYLREEDRSTTEIAFLLGFADGSAFSRAFKGWTGKSPAAFRAGH